MSTGNLLLGQGRNSIGDITLYTRNGKQVARARVRKIANPRSVKQAYQRMAFAAVSYNASWLNAIVSNSFDGYRNGGGDINRFSQVNLPLSRAAVVEQLEPALMPTRGSSQGCFWPGMILSDGMVPFDQGRVMNSDGFILPLNVDANGSMARADFLAEMAAAGLQLGDQVTFVQLELPTSVGAVVQWSYGRIIWTGIPEGAEISVVSPTGLNPLIFSYDNIAAEAIDNEVEITMANIGAAHTYARAAILTRVINGEQRHSRCVVQPTSELTGNNVDDVLDTYLGGASPASPDVESEWYTENAENPQ